MCGAAAPPNGTVTRTVTPFFPLRLIPHGRILAFSFWAAQAYNEGCTFLLRSIGKMTVAGLPRRWNFPG